MIEYLTRKHLGHPPRADEAQGAWDFYHGTRAMNGGDDPTYDEAVTVTLSSVQVCIPQYRARHWRLETSRKPIFLTSDAPLVLWRPETPSDAYQGFGLEGAHEIRFPVSPTAQLVLVPGQGTSAEEVKLSRVISCNQDLADSCEQVVIGHPDPGTPRSTRSFFGSVTARAVMPKPTAACADDGSPTQPAGTSRNRTGVLRGAQRRCPRAGRMRGLPGGAVTPRIRWGCRPRPVHWATAPRAPGGKAMSGRCLLPRGTAHPCPASYPVLPGAK